MKKAQLVDIKKIEIIEEQSQAPGENEVLLDVCAVGICGSDIPRFKDGRVHFFPIVLGHEISAIVRSVGTKVKNVTPGDHVAVIPLKPCYECESCQSGNFSLCKNYKFIGSSVDGGFSEQMILSEKNIYKLPSQISHEDAIFFETSTVALHAVNLLGDIYGKSIAVIGTGTIGLLCAQWCKLKGAKIVAVGRTLRNEKCEKLGISYISTENAIQTCCSQFDGIVDAVGHFSTISNSLHLLKKNGVLSLVGTPSENMVFDSASWTLINRKELVLKGSWMGYSAPFPGKEWDEVKKALINKKLVLSEILLYEKKFPLEKIQEAFELFLSESRIKGRVLIFTKNLLFKY